MYDAIIVGSGPAGAMTAIRLASKNKSVLLLDRDTFPRDKVCGDGMPYQVMTLLDDIGLDVKKFNLPHQQIENLEIIGPANTRLYLREARTTKYSMVAKRYHFDAMLHTHALDKGAHFQQANVSGFLKNPDDKVTGVVTQQNGETREYEGNHIIVANGAGTLLNKSFEVRQKGEKTIAIRAYGQTAVALEPAVKFLFLKKYLPGYAWIFPVGLHECNVGVYLDAVMLRKQSAKLSEMLDEFCESLDSQYQISLDTDSIKTWSLPIYTNPATRHNDNLFLAGDAAYFINALTGGGIHTAMLSGLLVADCILEDKDYNTEWKRELQGSLRVSHWLKRYFANGFTFGKLLSLGNLPFMQKRIMKSIAGDHF